MPDLSTQHKLVAFLVDQTNNGTLQWQPENPPGMIAEVELTEDLKLWLSATSLFVMWNTGKDGFENGTLPLSNALLGKLVDAVVVQVPTISPQCYTDEIPSAWKELGEWAKAAEELRGHEYESEL